jgi:hypothetical protein
MLALQQLGNERRGVTQSDELAATRQRDRIIEGAVPALSGIELLWLVPDLTFGADIKVNARLPLHHFSGQVACRTFQQA